MRGNNQTNTYDTKNTLEAEKFTETTDVLPSDGASCSSISRLEAIARAAVGHSRFGVSSIGGSVHITLDGWDVGGYFYEKSVSNAGLKGTTVDLAEVILGLANVEAIHGADDVTS